MPVHCGISAPIARQVDAFEDGVCRVSAFANDRLAADQIDGNGEARHRKLFEPPVVKILPEHGVESPAAVLMEQVPVAAFRKAAKEP